MYTDIFSSFDPATRTSYIMSQSIFILICALLPLIIKAETWLVPSQKLWLLTSIKDIIVSQTNRTTASHIKGSASLLVPLFMLLISINLIGLLPYSFRLSSHILFSFSFGIPLWIIIILSALSHDPKSFLAHLLPAGAPTWLNPFLVLIETLRNFLRPLTLSFRLAANIRAGHIILTLASTFLIGGLVRLNPQSTITLLFICSFYTIFEIAICLIQAYIFCLLLSLYTDDHPLSTESLKANRFRLDRFILHNLYWDSLSKYQLVALKTLPRSQ